MGAVGHAEFPAAGLPAASRAAGQLSPQESAEKQGEEHRLGVRWVVLGRSCPSLGPIFFTCKMGMVTLHSSGVLMIKIASHA